MLVHLNFQGLLKQLSVQDIFILVVLVLRYEFAFSFMLVCANV